MKIFDAKIQFTTDVELDIDQTNHYGLEPKFHGQGEVYNVTLVMREENCDIVFNDHSIARDVFRDCFRILDE